MTKKHHDGHRWEISEENASLQGYMATPLNRYCLMAVKTCCSILNNFESFQVQFWPLKDYTASSAQRPGTMMKFHKMIIGVGKWSNSNIMCFINIWIVFFDRRCRCRRVRRGLGWLPHRRLVSEHAQVLQLHLQTRLQRRWQAVWG